MITHSCARGPCVCRGLVVDAQAPGNTGAIDLTDDKDDDKGKENKGKGKETEDKKPAAKGRPMHSTGGRVYIASWTSS